MTPALAVSGLEKAYGSVRALVGVDLEVGEGELVGLLGPNGAGKTTLVKIACGLVAPTAGSAEVCGAPAGSVAAHRALGYLAELFRFPDWCTGDELLALHQQLAASDGGARERAELLELVGLSEAGGRRVGTMSKGMQQRLGLAQALIGSPQLLLLDEPTSALDPVGRRTVRALLEELRGARRGGAAELAPAVRGRARLRPRGDRRPRRAGGGGHAVRARARGRRRGGDRGRDARCSTTPAARTRRGSCASSSPRARRSTACACSRRRSRTPTWRRWGAVVSARSS